MKKIAITTEHFWQHEARAIVELLDSGYWRVHIRKPKATALQTEQLLKEIPEHYRQRLSLHDHFELCNIYNIGGVHLNSRNSVVPNYFQGVISRSCHTIEELSEADKFNYLFLSPIFNSISKAGYQAAFTIEQLQQAQNQGIINEKVFALGGVTLMILETLEQLGFGGAALLGAAWTDYTILNN